MVNFETPDFINTWTLIPVYIQDIIIKRDIEIFLSFILHFQYFKKLSNSVSDIILLDENCIEPFFPLVVMAST